MESKYGGTEGSSHRSDVAGRAYEGKQPSPANGSRAGVLGRPGAEASAASPRYVVETRRHSAWCGGAGVRCVHASLVGRGLVLRVLCVRPIVS